MQYKSSSEPLATFIQRKGGINKCARVLLDASGDTVELRLEQFHIHRPAVSAR
jgi:hypothetical protein